MIPPVAWAQTPRGYVRMEANSAHELERVSKEFEAQKKCEFAMIDEAQCARIEAKHKEIRGRLHAAKSCAGTSNAARDMIDRVLKKLEEGEKNLRQRRIEGHLAIEAG